MAFKLTYSDGQESTHDDDTVWELDDGVLKLGREKDKWSVLLSPSHWAVLELVASSSSDSDGADEKDGDKSDDGKDSDDDDKSDDGKDSDDDDKSEKDDKSDKSDKDDDK
ncbi:hypothetical protein [Mycolicibacterium obuense]|uniref:Uncharacterized protein n=1 Tax=Mycolicibacterium obuense TaxID=1807 RepID=A0A0J6VZ14_9MYCO|nr:hypothetical protein [Mycolicibacterium obuense]KMO74708.1 hypothetical protein MOBUDSM44075_03427 [Mycolicibacterium obuense]